MERESGVQEAGSDAAVHPGHSLVYSSSEFESLSLPNIGYWMEHMIPKKGIVLLHGKYGAWKTAIGLNIAKGVAEGNGLWDKKTESTRVLFLECDTPVQALQPRAKTLGFSGLSVDFSPAYPGIDVVNPKRDEWNWHRYMELHKLHLDKPYGLVIIDSLRTIHSMSEKEGETAKEVYLAAARMFPDATVLLIHHDRKTSREEGNWKSWRSQEQLETEAESFMGSQRWIDLATTALKISKHGKQGIVIQQSKSQWGLISKPIFLVPNGDGVTLTPPATIDDNSIAAAVPVITKQPIRNLGELDRKLAKHFGVSDRYIRNFRIEWEERNGQIPVRSRG
ncbi:MAG: AAA family ATPase [Anaerolineae bacterium]|nr:AAA family ATPase [Anaerolineae bacterium]NIN96231.1 AAA family ATPase [Anaerolineae bacterium]NIQ79252.1 AAA family ATPase [Anaerolineae bacterium]